VTRPRHHGIAGVLAVVGAPRGSIVLSVARPPLPPNPWLECPDCGWRCYPKPVHRVSADGMKVEWAIGENCDRCGKPLRERHGVAVAASP
jgi:hypothetical protein